MFDLIFICDANSSVGFGHASRCANIAKQLLDLSKNIKIGFIGNYVSEVKKRIITLLGSVEFLSYDDNYRSSCVIIDALGDNSNPDILPLKKFDIGRKFSKNLVFLSSGATIRGLPEDIICIGYQPSGINSIYPKVYWGLKYAPTLKVTSKNIIKRDSSSILLALGGINNSVVFNSIIDALKDFNSIKEVNILLSPVNQSLKFKYDQNSNYFKTYSNIKSISPLLYKVGLVIASFGNLSYEALAHATPLCSVGTKKFQAEYGEFLFNENLAYNVGLIDCYNPKKVSVSIKKTIKNAGQLSHNATLKVDDRGIFRIANIIRNYI